jgi:hypothetical protein
MALFFGLAWLASRQLDSRLGAPDSHSQMGGLPATAAEQYDPADAERLPIVLGALLPDRIEPCRGFEGPIPPTAADAKPLCLLFGFFIPVRVVALPSPGVPAHVIQISRRMPAKRTLSQVGAGVAAGDVAWTPGCKNDRNIFAARL